MPFQLTRAAGNTHGGRLKETRRTKGLHTKFGLRILALALLSTGSAAAQDVADWSGPYAGLSFGRESGPQIYFENDVRKPGVNELSGGAVGIFAGYNFQFGSLVVGPEAEFARSDIRYAGNGYNHKQIADLRLRVGYAFGSTLAYAAAGYSGSPGYLGAGGPAAQA